GAGADVVAGHHVARGAAVGDEHAGAAGAADDVAGPSPTAASAADGVVVRSAGDPYAVVLVGQGGRAGGIDPDEVAFDNNAGRGRQRTEVIDGYSVAPVAGDQVAGVGGVSAEETAGALRDDRPRR